MSRGNHYRLLGKVKRAKSPMQPILDNPVPVMAGIATIMAVLGAGIWVGLFLRRKRLGTYRSPYESRGFLRGRSDDFGEYEAVGI